MTNSTLENIKPIHYKVLRQQEMETYSHPRQVMSSKARNIKKTAEKPDQKLLCCRAEIFLPSEGSQLCTFLKIWVLYAFNIGYFGFICI